jgi:hypothetical protein
METKQVEMTAEELQQFEAFKAEKAKRDKAKLQKQNRDTYKDLIDETVNKCFPELQELSKKLAAAKTKVYEEFRQALLMKADIFETKTDQRSHTFTNKEGNRRIILGEYEVDGYDDTADEGLEMIKNGALSIIKDNETKALVNTILKLASKNSKGVLKPSKVMQLRAMAEELNVEKILDGVKIVEAAYRPEISKSFVRAQFKTKIGKWEDIPLGMTEA